VGLRYDVEVLPKDGGGLRAVKVKPSADDVGDPTEIKGRIEARAGERFELSGIPLRLAPAVEIYGEVPAGAGPELLVDGLLVKVVVSTADEALEVRRVKVYAPDAGAESEVRGDLAAFEGSAAGGQLLIGGLSIAVDANTHWKHIDSARTGLAREQVLEWLTAPAEGARFVLQRHLGDLAADPGELQAPRDVAPESPLDRSLDSLLRDLAARRVWRPGDEEILDAESLKKLRGLGY
jgi:hypothetical protein